jgi:phosphate transport system protein
MEVSSPWKDSQTTWEWPQEYAEGVTELSPWRHWPVTQNTERECVEPMATHFEASLERDINRIRSKMTEMSTRAERALQDSLKAITENNRQLAYAVILRDQYIDEMEKEVDRLCLEFLVRQQPVGQTLRFAYSAIKINLELERVGDYAESIARQFIKLSDVPVDIPRGRITELAERSIPMLRDAIKSFVEQDAELANKTIAIEEAVDLLKSKLNKDLVALFRENKLPFEALNPLMMITRRFERVSDQARNICMETLYMCTGEYSKHQGTEVFRVLFVDEHNSCRSLIAEAVANALNQPKFVFASAGLEPRPMAADTAAFLKAAGHDISHLVPKAIHQVPNLDHYHVIVALSPEVRKAFPQKPRKVVYLDWSVNDPSAVQGTPEQINAAHQEAYQFIKAHIDDAVKAILET